MILLNIYIYNIYNIILYITQSLVKIAGFVLMEVFDTEHSIDPLCETWISSFR